MLSVQYGAVHNKSGCFFQGNERSKKAGSYCLLKGDGFDGKSFTIGI